MGPRVATCRLWLGRIVGLLLSLALLSGPSAAAAATQSASPVAEPGLAAPADSRPPAAAGSQSAAPTESAPRAAGEAAAAYGRLPLSFEANRGQADASADFVAHASGFTLLLGAGQATLQARPPAAAADPPAAQTTLAARTLRLELHGANPQPRATGASPLPGTVNYFIGDDPSRWQTDVPTFGQVQYRDVYPGVDLVFYGRQRQLEYDFVVAPGADPTLIRVVFAGADQVELDPTGAVVARVADAELRQPLPVVYQPGPDGPRAVDGGYVLNDRNEVGFLVGAYDPSLPLILDPVLAYSTFLGGSADANEFADDIVVDAHGNAYITGGTDAADFPSTPSPFQHVPQGGTDAFVTKLNPTGTALIYSAVFGGRASETGEAIAVDATGSVYVTGSTASPDFPATAGVFQRPGGIDDLFVTKLNPAGTALVYSTRLGGRDTQTGRGIAVDATGNAYVTGFTGSADFPTTAGAFQPRLGGGDDAYVLKLNPTATGLVYSTFLGGDGFDAGDAIAVDAAGNAFVGGITSSTSFPTTPSALQPTTGGGEDGFVTRLNSTGTDLAYSTYLGGPKTEAVHGVKVDASGNLYVTGGTESADFPTTAGAFQRTAGGGSDAFVSKLNPAGSDLLYSTLLGGRGADAGLGIAVDSSGAAFVVGDTSSSDFPTTPGSLGPGLGGTNDAFVTRLNPTGSAVIYATLLGGSTADTGTGIAVDASGNAYVTGTTTSTNFPISPGAYKPKRSGFADAFVVQLKPGPPACKVLAVLAGPPAQLRVLVHADRGLSKLVVTGTTNATVAVPGFTSGSTATVQVTATKVDQTRSATVTLLVTDQTGSSTRCDPAIVSVGRGPDLQPVQVVRHLAASESTVTIANGSRGLDRVRLVVNGHSFKVDDLRDGEIRTLDVSSAMRAGTSNSLLVTGHGPRDSNAVVMVADS